MSCVLQYWNTRVAVRSTFFSDSSGAARPMAALLYDRKLMPYPRTRAMSYLSPSSRSCSTLSCDTVGAG